VTKALQAGRVGIGVGLRGLAVTLQPPMMHILQTYMVYE
jgi:hypothetical protein